MEHNLALLQRLQTYSLDDPTSSFPFSAKLAKENGWSASFAQRAIEEYKRFTYLAVTAGHPVSPSDVVDEVWHMHLTYSHEYWKNFCPNILQMEFHHYPSKGGFDEREKFADWSRKTRESYREAFGEDPPANIWESEPVKPKVEFYTIPKALVRTVLQGAGLAAVLFFLVGCAESMSGNPLDYKGPDFLQFYLILWIVCFVVALTVRNLLRVPASVNEGNYLSLDPYSVAYLNGKQVLAVNAAITNLLAQGVVEFDRKGLRVKTIDSSYIPSNGLEGKILSLTGGTSGAKITTIRSSCQTLMTGIQRELENRGLLLSENQKTISVLTSFFISLVAPLYGLMKINVGLSREKPVLFLVLLCCLSAVASVCLLIKPFRTRAGDAGLKLIRERQGHLRTVGQRTQSPGPDVAMGIALFGAAAMYGSPYHTQVRAMQPQAGSSSCGGGSYNSGCSSSSGGGGSCGGGGSSCGGGGGCGGCGS